MNLLNILSVDKDPNNCGTCAYFTGRRPTSKQMKRLKAEYEMFDALAEAKREEREKLSEEMRKPFGPNHEPYNDVVWLSAPIQKLNRERYKAFDDRNAVMYVMHPNKHGSCTKDPPKVVTDVRKEGIFGTKTEVYTKHPDTQASSWCGAYLKKVGL